MGNINIIMNSLFKVFYRVLLLELVLFYQGSY